MAIRSRQQGSTGAIGTIRLGAELVDDLEAQPVLADPVQDSIVIDAAKKGCSIEVAIRAFDQQSRVITVRVVIRCRNECVQQLKRSGRRKRKYRSAIRL